jgi:hypothetical protein
LSLTPPKARTRVATVRIAGRPDLLTQIAFTSPRTKWQTHGVTDGVWVLAEPTSEWQNNSNNGSKMHGPQTEIPDDLKRDEALSLDLRGAIDAIEFQLRMIRETLARIEAAIGLDVH